MDLYNYLHVVARIAIITMASVIAVASYIIDSSSISINYKQSLLTTNNYKSVSNIIMCGKDFLSLCRYITFVEIRLVHKQCRSIGIITVWIF